MCLSKNIICLRRINIFPYISYTRFADNMYITLYLRHVPTRAHTYFLWKMLNYVRAQCVMHCRLREIRKSVRDDVTNPRRSRFVVIHIVPETRQSSAPLHRRAYTMNYCFPRDDYRIVVSNAENQCPSTVVHVARTFPAAKRFARDAAALCRRRKNHRDPSARTSRTHNGTWNANRLTWASVLFNVVRLLSADDHPTDVRVNGKRARERTSDFGYGASLLDGVPRIRFVF